MLDGKTVVFGGSFNPPHRGHALLCRYLLDELDAAEVWVVPVNNHPLGKSAVGFSHRYEMCRLLAASLGPRVVVSDVERRLGGEGRTLDLLKHLLSVHPERRFALGVGADVLHEADKWHRWDEICQLVPLVVLGREGVERVGVGGAVLAGVPDLVGISSTEIRGLVRKGEDIREFTVPSVADYIEEWGLYAR